MLSKRFDESFGKIFVERFSNLFDGVEAKNLQKKF